MITAAVLGAYAPPERSVSPTTQAVTVAFVTLGLAQLWHVFDMADADVSFLLNDVTRNRWVWAAVALCVALILGGVSLPRRRARSGVAARRGATRDGGRRRGPALTWPSALVRAISTPMPRPRCRPVPHLARFVPTTTADARRR